MKRLSAPFVCRETVLSELPRPSRKRPGRVLTLQTLGTILFGLLLSGCTPKAAVDPYKEGLLLSRSYADRYGEIASQSATRYLDYVAARLLNAIPEDETIRYPRVRFVLLQTNKPMAFSPGGGFLLLSRGLIRNLGSEAELAFIVAHEIAHEQLSHTDFHLEHQETDALDSYRKDLEREADKYAVGLMALAAYDPRGAVNALNNAHRAAGSPEGNTHPSVLARSQAIEWYIRDSGWRPPGTTNRRDFQKFRLAMQGDPNYVRN